MTTQEVAKRFYTLAQEGKFDEILDGLFSNDAHSVEPQNAQGLKSVSGLDKIKEKGKEWNESIQEMQRWIHQ